MSKVKKIIIGVLVAALVTTGAGAGLLSMRKANQKEVMVASVESLASNYYMPSTTLEGYITTSVSQNVYVDKDMIIENVYVQKGDNVNTGDKLITFDMTLVQMELNIAKLKRQKQEQDLNKAVNRLNSLQNGGPIEESDGTSPGNADNLNPTDMNDTDNGDDELGRLEMGTPGNYLAAAVQPLLVAAFSDSGSDEAESAASGDDIMGTEENTSGGDEDIESAGQGETQTSDSQGMSPDGIYQDPSAGDFSSGEDKPEIPDFDSGKDDDAPKPSPTPTPELDDDTEFFDPYTQEGYPDLTDGQDPFYLELDGDTLPFAGKGTESDPYIFLCSSAKGYVKAKGSFFNKMAGYSEDGTKILHEGGYWYQLEFHSNDTIMDYQNRKESCTGYYLIDGSLLQEPVDMYSEMEFTLEGASQYEEELPPDDGGGGTNEPVSTMTRAEAIKLQKNKIASLKLDLQESDINITKLEKKVNRQIVNSKLDGTVTYVGDALTGTSEGNAFIKVKSKEGFYVKGTVSELLLDQVKEGATLNCMSYENGNFTAEVVDVSDYPISGNSYGFGDSNPNVSYYTFSAKIPDKSVTVRDQEWLNITLDAPVQDGSFVLSKAFVRTENGSSFVYKDDNGVLKKQAVTVGGSVEGGYSVLIKGGIKKEDKIAFPYGKAVQEGARTKEATLEEFYGYN